MLETIATSQNKFLTTKSSQERKRYGQFYTDALVADYMTSMIRVADIGATFRILDAGAGAGILASSAALHCLRLGCATVHVVLYEVDRGVLLELERNMALVEEAFTEAGARFTFDLRCEDFVLVRPDLHQAPFHTSVINPPYFKYNSKTSPYASATQDLFSGNPNIYASFMAIVSKCLAPGGSMVAIVPRSFTNGLYFRGFRQYLSQAVSLQRLHIFRSRNRVFKSQKVLQENIIAHFVKRAQAPEVTICSSTGPADLDTSEINHYPADLIIDNTNHHQIIRIPESREDAEILEMIETWPASFRGIGYYISTGPVVEHRTREYITQDLQTNAVPLLRMHNVKPFATQWTGAHKKDARFCLKHNYHKHITRNSVYVMLKRFSSKDEARRLVAGVHDPRQFSGDLIALENHLNYIGRIEDSLSKDSPFTIEEAFGLAALLNSTVMDRYFRCISGSTQVNATEIRLLKLPCREDIIDLGRAVLNSGSTNQTAIDHLLSPRLCRWGLDGAYKPEDGKKAAEAKTLLKALGMPKTQSNDRSARVLLVLANIKPHDPL